MSQWKLITWKYVILPAFPLCHMICKERLFPVFSAPPHHCKCIMCKYVYARRCPPMFSRSRSSWPKAELIFVGCSLIIWVLQTKRWDLPNSTNWLTTRLPSVFGYFGFVGLLREISFSIRNRSKCGNTFTLTDPNSLVDVMFYTRLEGFLSLSWFIRFGRRDNHSIANENRTVAVLRKIIIDEDREVRQATVTIIVVHILWRQRNWSGHKSYAVVLPISLLNLLRLFQF